MKLKSILIVSLMLSFSIVLIAQEGHVPKPQQLVFQTQGWKKAVKTAKLENKYIFIQFVIDDCKPCEKMKSEVWTDYKIGVQYSKNFILFSPKEGDSDAKYLTSKYKVNTYPTSIFVDANGKLIHKYLGYTSKTTMVEMSEKVLSKTNTLSYLDQLYKNKGSKMGPNLQYEYALTLMNAGQPYEKVASSYFKTQPTEELLSEENLIAMMLFTDKMDSREFKVLVRSRAEYRSDTYSEVQIALKIEDVISNALISSLESSSSIVLKDTLESTLNYFRIADREPIISRVELDNYDYIEKNEELYFQALNRYVMSHIGSLSNTIIADKAIRVLNESSNMADLDNAILWVDESMMIDGREDEEMLIIMVRLLDKINRHDEMGDVMERLKMIWIEDGYSNEEVISKYNQVNEILEQDRNFTVEGDEKDGVTPIR